MRAGEAFWAGRDEALQYALDKMIPSALQPRLDGVVVRTARVREGLMFRADKIAEWEAQVGPYSFTWRYSVEQQVAATECAERATAAVERLGAVVKGFRETVKNDTASMKAASDRVQSEVLQMAAKYKQAQDLLTSPDFERAIANAERMAAALEAISRLAETKLSVAVFSGGSRQDG